MHSTELLKHLETIPVYGSSLFNHCCGVTTWGKNTKVSDFWTDLQNNGRDQGFIDLGYVARPTIGFNKEYAKGTYAEHVVSRAENYGLLLNYKEKSKFNSIYPTNHKPVVEVKCPVTEQWWNHANSTYRKAVEEASQSVIQLTPDLCLQATKLHNDGFVPFPTQATLNLAPCSEVISLSMEGKLTYKPPKIPTLVVIPDEYHWKNPLENSYWVCLLGSDDILWFDNFANMNYVGKGNKLRFVLLKGKQ